MKGFIELTLDSKDKIFVAVSSIWSIGVESSGMVGIYTIPTFPKHLEVIETIDEIAAKIEEEEQPKTEPRQNIYYRTSDRLPTAEDADADGFCIVSEDAKEWLFRELKYAHTWTFWAPVPKVEVRL